MKKWHTTVMFLSFHLALLFWAWGKVGKTPRDNEKPVIGYTSTLEVVLWPERGEIEVNPIKEGDFEPWSERVRVVRCDGIWGVVKQDGTCFEIDEKRQIKF